MIEFGKIILVGLSFGFTFANALGYAIKRQLIPHYLLNIATLASVLGVFVISDFFAHESGLLSVVIMGMTMGNRNLPNIKDLLYFQRIAQHFTHIDIIYTARSQYQYFVKDLLSIYEWKTAWLFFAVVLLIRPLGVLISTHGSMLNIKEKLFVSWVGPRGIVAAGIASLFGLKLVSQDEPGAEYITPTRIYDRVWVPFC